jgi:hypothetical protein
MKFLDQTRFSQPRLTNDHHQLAVALPRPLPAPHASESITVRHRSTFERVCSSVFVCRGRARSLAWSASAGRSRSSRATCQAFRPNSRRIFLAIDQRGVAVAVAASAGGLGQLLDLGRGYAISNGRRWNSG